ncbi:hypothetical protein, partial [Staphylococcus hominis]
HIHFTINENIASLNLTSVTNYMGGVDIIIGRNQFTPAPKNFRRDGEYKILDNSSEYIQEAPDWVVEWLLDTKKQKKEKEMTQDVGAS